MSLEDFLHHYVPKQFRWMLIDQAFMMQLIHPLVRKLMVELLLYDVASVLLR